MIHKSLEENGGIRASIDLGTNTCLLLLAQVESKKVIKILKDESEIIGLGKGVDGSRHLSSDAQQRALDCLKKYVDIVRGFGLPSNQVRCVATSQARDASNGAEFFKVVEDQTGLRFKTITGSQEAKYAFLGALLPGMEASSTCVMDIGGGSTEIVFSNGEMTSMDMGSVRFTERYLPSDPVTDQEFWKCQSEIDRMLGSTGFSSSVERQIKSLSFLGVAGTITTLAQWFLGDSIFDREKIDQTILSKGDVHRMVEELKWRTIRERSELPGVSPLRAQVLLAGAMIFWRAMEFLSFTECRVSTRGLRFGVIVQDQFNES